MKNIYKPGFFALLVALLFVSGGVFWASWTNGKAGSTQDAFAFINSLSALIQALAAGVVAWLAHKGLTNWKQELIHSKAHGVVWDANIAFRKVEASIERLGLAWQRSTPTMDAKTVVNFLSEDAVSQQFDDFLEQCQILDKVVLKSDWVWADRAKNLRDALISFAIEVHKPERTAAMGLVGCLNGRTREKVEAAGDLLLAAIKPIQDGLKELDQKYDS